ncbi:iron ABC transporter permease [Enterococcus dongliensis]|uniref:Iron ABC transporter permease n=1 Tax=Enterococcus dongliensis TaxID=2559925 RepID=A0AAP5KTA0_9ENTE|nr:iron ABC transporter permease [Enterococcus dongliensis]MDT2597014.1 iron ABC transporter permease [Enterococcus dongliensis]MDT2603034.1 iron ABC transporter permease [Enterococcus dongliensis]MDT2633378.1 iron ABC transporter permease [Enterococcus dongliensis]MDT2636729.1 iron ABC transporter permease [Enterococcus dongliensis]MDT2638848.1 iron ABC transporter permease [Enterococcus dongliensis]
MRKKIGWLSLLFLLMIGASLSLTVGSIPLTFNDLIHVFQGTAKTSQQLIVFDFRVPRLLVSILAGMGLAVSGYLFQTITHNDLADPGILGINAGAGLTVLIYLGFFARGESSWYLPLIACAGSFIATALVYYFGRQAERITPNRLLLAGVAVNAGISALTLIGTIRVSRDNYQFVTSWLAGTIWGTTQDHVWLLLPWLVFLLPLILLRGRSLEVLELGDEIAVGLGIKLKRTQLFFLICAVCLAAVSVSIAGSISFIGLIAPHIARQLTGRKNNQTLVMSALIGGILLLFSDILARVILPDGEMAAGIIVSLIGAPYFIFQLMKKNR